MTDLRDRLDELARTFGDADVPPDLAQRGRRFVRRRRAAAAVTAAVAVTAVVLVLPGQARQGRSAPAVNPAATAQSLANGGWTTGSASPVTDLERPTLTWTGKEVLVVGGAHDRQFAHESAAYDPAHDSWRRLRDAPDLIGVGNGPQVWTGDSLFVLQGTYARAIRDTTPPTRALLYDPDADSWRTTPELPHALDPANSTAVLVDGKVLVVGLGANEKGTHAELYDPAHDSWQVVEQGLPTDHDANVVRAVTTSDGVFAWSTWVGSSSNEGDGVDVLRFRDGHWDDLSERLADGQVYDSVLVAESGRISMSLGQPFCLRCLRPVIPRSPSKLLDPATLTTTELPDAYYPSVYGDRIWTGAAEVAVETNLDEGGTHPFSPGSAAVRDPATGWAPLPKAPVVPVSEPVWAGDRMIIIGTGAVALTFG